MKIDIERLIDAVTAENEAYNEYCHSSKTLYRGPFEEITARKNHVNYAREVHDREQNAIDTLTEVFQMDAETRNRLYLHLAEQHQESRSCTVRNGRKYILCSY